MNDKSITIVLRKGFLPALFLNPVNNHLLTTIMMAPRQINYTWPL